MGPRQPELGRLGALGPLPSQPFWTSMIFKDFSNSKHSLIYKVPSNPPILWCCEEPFQPNLPTAPWQCLGLWGHHQEGRQQRCTEGSPGLRLM